MRPDTSAAGVTLPEDRSFLSVSLSRLELSDEKVYDPEIRGTTAHVCQVVVLKLSISGLASQAPEVSES